MGLSLRRGLEATDEEVALALGPEFVELKHKLAAMELAPEDGEAPVEEPEAEDEVVEDEVVETAADETDDEPEDSGPVAAAEDEADASSAKVEAETPVVEAEADDADDEAATS
jgi:hypothetical protein